MPKIVKYIVFTILGLVALLVIAVAVIAATLDPNDYKSRIIQSVQDKTQRTLTIPGDIKLTFFPKIGVDLGKVSLSERNSTAEFASLNNAKVSLALMPLLSRQLVVDQIYLDGLNATVRRYKDGTTNFDDLVSKEAQQPNAQQDEQADQQVQLDVAGVEITNAHVLYEDQQQARKFELDNLNLKTGKIANGVPSTLQLTSDVISNKPEINANVDVKTGFTLNLDQKQYVLNNLDAQIQGKLANFSNVVLQAAGDMELNPESKRFILDGMRLTIDGKRAEQTINAKLEAPTLAITDTQVNGGKIHGEARLSEGARVVMVNFNAPSFEGTPQAFRVPSLGLDVSIKDNQLDAKANIAGALNGNIDKMLFSSPQISLTLAGKQGDTAINGSLTTPVTADMKDQVISLANIAAAFNLPNPAGGTLNLKAGGNASIDLGKQNLSAALKGNLDQSAFDAKLGLAKFSPAAYTFDLGIDQIDLDRYKSKPAAGVSQAPASKSEQQEQPLNLSALQNLRAKGSVRIGALKVANIKMTNARFDLNAAGGKLDINPLAANLYGGSASGAISVVAAAQPRFALRQNLVGINVGPLLKDAMDKNPIAGRGNVQLDINAVGATVTQMKKALNGTARLELRDGAIQGVNIAQVIRNAKTRIGALRGNEAPQTGTGAVTEKTDFSEFSGSFRVTNGAAHNDDLIIKSPLLRIGGSGDINIGEDRLDYLVRATVVSTLQGQEGPELQALKGLTVPVRLFGPFNAIQWRVDFAGIASELAKQKLDERKEELRSKAEKALEKSKVDERLKEQLKGLFGR